MEGRKEGKKRERKEGEKERGKERREEERKSCVLDWDMQENTRGLCGFGYLLLPHSLAPGRYSRRQ